MPFFPGWSGRSPALEDVGGEPASRAGAAEGLLRIERHIVALLEQLGLDERRRLGKVFRIRRDAQLRGSSSGSRRRRSQTELYEMARRAGVEHRSRMTQAQLQAAIEARSSG